VREMVGRWRVWRLRRRRDEWGWRRCFFVTSCKLHELELGTLLLAGAAFAWLYLIWDIVMEFWRNDRIDRHQASPHQSIGPVSLTNYIRLRSSKKNFCTKNLAFLFGKARSAYDLQFLTVTSAFG
jgi:hypothetical protein